MYTFTELVEKAKKVHGDKYIYDESTFKKSVEKMRIICPIHGEFWQSMHCHINKKQGCPLCGKTHERKPFKKKNKLTKENFLSLCCEKFGNKFEYDLTDYKNLSSKITVTCPEHGTFKQTASSHLNSKYGCPKCAADSISKKNTLTTEGFIKKATAVHGGKYDYSKVVYQGNKRVHIICPIHGDFWQSPHNHLFGNGCPKCGRQRTIELNRMTQEDFIRRATEMHDSKYDYSKVKYVDYRTKVTIGCSIHGEFKQTPDDHLQGKGCPKCGNLLSKSENEIYEYCCSLMGKENVIQSEHNVIKPHEIDIYIPSLKIGIEYNGLRWHSEEFGKDRHYHIAKTLACEKKGIRLIQIFEDEYEFSKDLVLSKIKHILDKDRNLKKVYARKCRVNEISFETAKIFLKQNHIQGYSKSTVYLGCFSDDCIIAVMTFKQEKYNKWELTRFASDISIRCIGVAGKLFSFFIKTYNPNEVKSFADRRWTSPIKNLYTEIGFKLEKKLAPDYRYYSRKTKHIRYHKFGFRKKILHKKYGLPLTMTETEMVKELGYSKIWDCGLLKYIWKAKKG